MFKIHKYKNSQINHIFFIMVKLTDSRMMYFKSTEYRHTDFNLCDSSQTNLVITDNFETSYNQLSH